MAMAMAMAMENSMAMAMSLSMRMALAMAKGLNIHQSMHPIHQSDVLHCDKNQRKHRMQSSPYDTWYIARMRHYISLRSGSPILYVVVFIIVLCQR